MVTEQDMDRALDEAFKAVAGRPVYSPPCELRGPRQMWSSQELSDLHTLARLNFTGKEIARALRRTEASIKGKCCFEGISLRSEDDQ